MSNTLCITFGVPAIDSKTVLESRKKLVNHLLTIVGSFSSKLNERFKVNSNNLANDVINKLADLVHLVPASEYYHHAYLGGLFVHSIEVAIIALENGIEKKFNEEELFILFIMSLLHDVGKLHCDISIKSLDRKQWASGEETISVWLQRESIKRYQIFYKGSRNKNLHKKYINMFSKFVLAPEIMLLIIQFDKKLIDTFNENISGKFYGRNPYHKIVLDADGHSTKESFSKDIQCHISQGVCRLPVLYSKLLLTFIQNIIHSTSAEVIIIDNNIFLDYKVFMSFVFSELKHNNILYPHNYKQLMEGLIEYQFIESNHGKCIRYVVKYGQPDVKSSGTYVNVISKPIYFEVLFNYESKLGLYNERCILN
jgi:hypothetical protein